MVYTRKNAGTCSTMTTVELDDNNIIKHVEIVGGCNGNLKGICKLVEGRSAEEVMDDLMGLTCGSKRTSCPDQLALALKAAIEKNQQ